MNKKNIFIILIFLILQIAFDAKGDIEFSKDFIEEAEKLGININKGNQYLPPYNTKKKVESPPSATKNEKVPDVSKSSVAPAKDKPPEAFKPPVSTKDEAPKVSKFPASISKSELPETPTSPVVATKPKAQKVQKLSSSQPKQAVKLKKKNVVQSTPTKKKVPPKAKEHYFVSPESEINNKDFDEKVYYQRKTYDYKEKPPQFLIDQQNKGKETNLPKFMTQEELSRLLFTAVNEQNIGGIKALLQKGANINTQDKNNQYTPLMYAVKDGKADSLRYLLIRGANPNIKGVNQMSALHLATILNRLRVLRILLESGADIKAKDKHYKTFYDYASKSYLNTVVNDIYETRKNANEALLDFCVLGSLSGVVYSLQNKANINAQNRDGDTPLILAVRYKHNKLVAYLLSIGADASVKNKYGNDASTIAKLNHYNKIHDIIETVKFNRELYILGLTDSIIPSK